MFRCALLVAVCAIQLAAEDAKVGYVDCSSGDKHPPTAVFSNPCTSQPVGALSCGEEVKVLGREGPWLRIASADGGERYISVTSVSQNKDRFLALDFPASSGLHTRDCSASRPGSAIEVLSDTQGVDFGPYLQGVSEAVRKNWHRAIPESAQMKHGKVVIEFAITKDGSVRGMKLVPPSGEVVGLRIPSSSGDVSLDRAAWAGITGSNPFPPLPSEFGGQSIVLRMRFSYNPDKTEPK
jgi:TonB family protein